MVVPCCKRLDLLSYETLDLILVKLAILYCKFCLISTYNLYVMSLNIYSHIAILTKLMESQYVYKEIEGAQLSWHQEFATDLLKWPVTLDNEVILIIRASCILLLSIEMGVKPSWHLKWNVFRMSVIDYTKYHCPKVLPLQSIK